MNFAESSAFLKLVMWGVVDFPGFAKKNLKICECGFLPNLQNIIPSLIQCFVQPT